MRWALARDLVAALAIALPTLCWLASPSLAQQTFNTDDLRRMAAGLRNGTLSDSLVSDECRRVLEGHPRGQSIEEAMAGFLDVPEDIAAAAFCRALVQGIKADDLSVDEIALLIQEGSDPASDPASALAFGRLLRALYFSHVVTVSAEGGTPQ